MVTVQIDGLVAVDLGTEGGYHRLVVIAPTGNHDFSVPDTAGFACAPAPAIKPAGADAWSNKDEVIVRFYRPAAVYIVIETGELNLVKVYPLNEDHKSALQRGFAESPDLTAYALTIEKLLAKIGEEQV